MAAGEGNTASYAAKDSSGVLAPYTFDRREVGPDDVAFKVLFCGICHTDLHQIRNDWGISSYPMVPGHEVIGRVTKVGANVTKFQEGQNVGVGFMVRSCLSCDVCAEGFQQHCPKVVYAFNTPDVDGTTTMGGFSSAMVVDQNFLVNIPEGLPLDAAAPLLCAGLTMYAPMVQFGLNQPGKTMGIIGLGGLGHMGVKLAKAMGLRVVVISRSPNKEEEAKTVLGADAFLNSTDKDAMEAAKGTMHSIIDTVSNKHDIQTYMDLLSFTGKYVIVGLPSEPLAVSAAQLVFGRKTVVGSLIGNVKETQDMLKLCVENNITCQVETIPIDYVNTAMERLAKGDIKYRFVVDVEGSLKKE